MTIAPPHAEAAALCPARCPVAFFGVTSARRFSNPSAVTNPAATSSHRPVSTSALSLARRAHHVREKECSALLQQLQH